MNSTEFSAAHSITDAAPQRIKKNAFTTKAFAKCVKEFIEQNFAGLAEVECDIPVNLWILISSDYAAYFFKKLLTDIYGRIFLKISLLTDEKQLTITIKSDSPFPLDYYKTNELIRQARNAGCEILSADEGFVMTIPILKEASLSVYAIPVDHCAQIIKRSFNNIFFYNTDKSTDK